MLQLMVSTCTDISVVVRTEHNVKNQLLIIFLLIPTTPRIVA